MFNNKLLNKFEKEIDLSEDNKIDLATDTDLNVDDLEGATSSNLTRSNSYRSVFLGEEGFEDGKVKTKEEFISECGEMKWGLNMCDEFCETSYFDLISSLAESKGYDVENKSIRRIMRESGIKKEDLISKLFDAYLISTDLNLNFILLGTDPKEDCYKSTEEKPILDSGIVKNFYMISDSHKKKGCVLKLSLWSLLINDMYILGIIDNRKEIYLASKRNLNSMTGESVYYCEDIILPNNTRGRLSIFARELLGLLCTGYRLQKLKDGSEGCYPGKKHVSISLNQYVKLVRYFEKSGEWKWLYSSKLISFDFDFDKNVLRCVITT